ncbi:rod shape-determining protein MreC [Streptomyces sp. JJ36]|uniref:rod shape-determining protein MreC n=1 Tax=Streptomyces sp. JJ36 TaxID=2736645 RepID=UPI001F00F40C|nr:rod shape-determining protein MreC [Streptomyces sp. JJ36]MCF6525334.1 rod shape-determining protein MreC [Streptomyces sp. JJ36]
MRDTRESRLLLVLLVAIAFALITVDLRSGEQSPLDGARRGAATALGPVQEGVATAVDPVGNAIAAVRDSGDRHDRMQELEQEVIALKRELGSDDRNRARARELDGLLRVAGAGGYGVKPARVIAIGATQGFSWTVTIDAGSRDGLRPDMTVLNGDGLVGRITTVGRSTATVLLANDPDFTVGTRLEGTGELGFAAGRGGNAMTVQLLNGKAKVEEGDRLVTFGSHNSKPFVPGVPVGKVTEVERQTGDLTRTLRIRPFVSFSTLDLVGVVVEEPRKDPRDKVLRPDPRKPEPRPTVTVTATPGAEPGEEPAEEAAGEAADPQAPADGDAAAPEAGTEPDDQAATGAE